MTTESPATPAATPDALEHVLKSLLGGVKAQSKAAYAELSAHPDIQRAAEAIAEGDVNRFFFAVQYPVSQVLEGLITSILPGISEEGLFMFQQSKFVEMHIRTLIETIEGRGCGTDKTRTVMRAILRFLLTGQQIAWDYSQEYTFHLPKRVFTDHRTTMAYFTGLRHLYYGRPEPYLAALQELHMDLRDS